MELVIVSFSSSLTENLSNLCWIWVVPVKSMEQGRYWTRSPAELITSSVPVTVVVMMIDELGVLWKITNVYLQLLRQCFNSYYTQKFGVVLSIVLPRSFFMQQQLKSNPRPTVSLLQNHKYSSNSPFSRNNQ